MPVAHARLLQHQPDDRWQPEGGWTSSKSSNETHQITEERDCASQEASEANVQTTIHQASRQTIWNSVLHQRALNHIQHRHRVHLYDSIHNL